MDAALSVGTYVAIHCTQSFNVRAYVTFFTRDFRSLPKVEQNNHVCDGHTVQDRYLHPTASSIAIVSDKNSSFYYKLIIIL